MSLLLCHPEVVCSRVRQQRGTFSVFMGSKWSSFIIIMISYNIDPRQLTILSLPSFKLSANAVVHGTPWPVINTCKPPSSYSHNPFLPFYRNSTPISNAPTRTAATRRPRSVPGTAAAAAEAGVVSAAAAPAVAETTAPVVSTGGIESVVVAVTPVAKGVSATRLAPENAAVGDAVGFSEALSGSVALGFRTLSDGVSVWATCSRTGIGMG